MFSNRAFSPPEGLSAYQGLLWPGSLCCLWLRCCEQSCALVRICQTIQSASKKVFTWNISFIPGRFIGNQCPGDLLIRVLSWSLFGERGAGDLSAGNTRIFSRANKNNSRRGGRIQGGVEAEANVEGPLYPEQPCVSGFSSWPCHGWDLPTVNSGCLLSCSGDSGCPCSCDAASSRVAVGQILYSGDLQAAPV